jgi:hypothetical protein
MASPQMYTRIAGVLLMISIVAGYIGEIYIPSNMVVSGDVDATAKNILASELRFRGGFAIYLMEALSDVAPDPALPLIASPGTRGRCAADRALRTRFHDSLCRRAAIPFLGDLILKSDSLNAFSFDHRSGLATLSLKTYGVASSIFMVFYGVASFLRGCLIFRSGYLPKFLGALLTFAGLSLIVRNFVAVLAPVYASDFFLLPMFAAMLSMAVWLLVKGVDVAKWGDAAARN